MWVVINSRQLRHLQRDSGFGLAFLDRFASPAHLLEVVGSAKDLGEASGAVLTCETALSTA